MKKVAIVESAYARDAQVFTGDPATLKEDADKDTDYVDVKYTNLYLGVYEGNTIQEIKEIAAQKHDIHPNIISLIDIDGNAFQQGSILSATEEAKKLQENHKFINSNYTKIDTDKFYVIDGSYFTPPHILHAYYNPDSCAGGSIVQDTLYYPDILKAFEEASNDEDFWDKLYECAKQITIDINDDCFLDTAKAFIAEPFFCEYQTTETKEKLVAHTKNILESKES